ncbi:MAG: DUF1552 domain-containing protein [Deltaproteobacteria bacterium]
MSARFRLSRRAVLRGAGSIAIALPWLEIMEPERRAQAAPATARRFLAVYQPGGSVLERWRPAGTETSFTLSPILAPLEPVKSRIVVLDGIDMKSAVGEQNQAGMIALLSGTPQATLGTGYAQGPSLDQVLATRLRGARRFPSLSLAVRWATGKSHGSLHPINALNFEDNATFSPMPPRLDPQAIFSELFGSLGRADDAWDRSILDSVLSRYTALQTRLGAADRARLDAHIEQLRALERRLGTVVRCAPPMRVDTTGYDPASGLASADDGSIRDIPTDTMIPTVGRFMTDMLVMAMACDLTAVGTLQWTDSEAKHTFPWLGLSEHHHFYMNDGGYRPAELERISSWYSEQHAYLIRSMSAVDVGGHSLLDESIVFFGSNLQDAATHTKTNMPFLLAGNGGGLRTGRYLVHDHPSHNDLLSRLVNFFGDPRTTFGDPKYCSAPLATL